MKAFTLSEMLVVMSIMLILMALAIPVYRHSADWTLDVMPTALMYTRALAMQEGSAVMMVRADNLGTWAICMEVQGIPSIALIELDTKRLQIPDYDPAVVVYSNNGHLRPGMDVVIDGQVYTSTNYLVLDGEKKMVHRYLGGFAK